MSLEAICRLKEEFNDLNLNPLTNIGVNQVILPKKDNYFEWEFILKGPKDTSYAGGLFLLKAIFPDNYPEEHPEVYFITPVYHLNINPIKLTCQNLGHVSMSSLNFWYPNYKMKDIMCEIFCLFYMPNPYSPYGLDRAKEFKDNKNLYEEKVKYFTKKYASEGNMVTKELNSSWDFSYNK